MIATISRGKTYRHRSLTEVDMHVVRILWIYPEGFKLDIAWINRHHPEITYPDRVFLKRKDLENWSLVRARSRAAKGQEVPGIPQYEQDPRIEWVETAGIGDQQAQNAQTPLPPKT